MAAGPKAADPAQGHVPALHRPGQVGRPARAGGSPAPRSPLRRHRAPPARAAERGRRGGRQGTGGPRYLLGGDPRRGRGDHRPRPDHSERAHPVHTKGKEGAGAVAAGGAAARPPLRRHRAPPAGTDPRGRGRRRPGAGQVRRRPRPGARSGAAAVDRLLVGGRLADAAGPHDRARRPARLSGQDRRGAAAEGVRDRRGEPRHGRGAARPREAAACRQAAAGAGMDGRRGPQGSHR